MEILLSVLLGIIITRIACFIIDGQNNWSSFMTSIKSQSGSSDPDAELLAQLGQPTHAVGNIYFYKNMPMEVVAATGGAFYLPNAKVICVSRNKESCVLGLPLPNKSVIMHECGHAFFGHRNMTNWLVANINECMADTFSIVKCKNFNILRFILGVLEIAKVENPNGYKLHWLRAQYLKLLAFIFKINLRKDK